MPHHINRLFAFAISASSIVLSNAVCAADKPVSHTQVAPQIDGIIDSVWQQHPWQPIDKLLIGEALSPTDFNGKFKLMWDQNYLYMLAQIEDDVLADTHPNPLKSYWDDDCLEIFLDPDGSGGDHLYNYNAFAYHLALDGHAVDIGTQPDDFVLLDEHVDNRWQREASAPYRINWEARIKFYPANWETSKQSETLTAGKKFGFMLAYCDADTSGGREHFISSQDIVPVDGDKNLGYKTADVFTPMVLVESN